MRNSRYWILFAVCAVGWLIVFVSLAPSMSGEDVYIFRDAGWNLAASGSFESAALVQMRDLNPRLYAHYTPLMPLLFAGYASVFPRNAYAGTIFNLLIGLAAAAVALRFVLRQQAGALRNAAAAVVAILPIVFITYDRPEALALVLCGGAIAIAARPDAMPVFAGVLIALTFLDHPFGAGAAALWVGALFLARNWTLPERWMRTVGQIAIIAAVAVALIAPVSLVFYMLDHESLRRFAGHALGMHSGLGVAVSTDQRSGFLHGIRTSLFGAGILETFSYLLSLASSVLLAAWSFLHRHELKAAEWLPVLAGLGCALTAFFLFPGQRNYATFVAFLIPVGLLISSARAAKLATPGLSLLLLAVVIALPSSALSVVKRFEQRSSYRAAQQQPSYLRAQLPDREAIVAVLGDSYDLFKPEFHHMIRLNEVDDKDRYAKLAAVANCYDAFQGQAGTVIPLPAKLNATDFHLIQPDPEHMWVTLFGHRAMRGQWGYGCDLYLRNSAAAGKAPEGIQATQ